MTFFFFFFFFQRKFDSEEGKHHRPFRLGTDLITSTCYGGTCKDAFDKVEREQKIMKSNFLYVTMIDDLVVAWRKRLNERCSRVLGHFILTSIPHIFTTFSSRGQSRGRIQIPRSIFVREQCTMPYFLEFGHDFTRFISDSY